MALIDVGGDKAFGRHVEFLDAFSIPWAAIADGPALHPTSDLYQQLKDHGSFSAAEPGSVECDAWKEFWAAHGVFGVDDVFGNDGSMAGESEAHLKRLDPELLSRVGKGRSEPRKGAAFAGEYPCRRTFQTSTR
ncbi:MULTISPECIES: hypothetical protein [Streptomyces]|uniref:Uncharacterized protein n=1 Tax=Streptomyces viridochromogenes TaxID=1938 RepID=A0A0L8K9I6_STRVR|nr:MULTISPECIES: hypothetical protein [Streptomyces]KOG22538.1 hypothetical protein ADK34_21505 [Streptomyces viridochromogenes]